MKWVASTDSLDAEPGTLDGAMDLDRLVGVMRTTRVIAAIVAKHWRYQFLVNSYKTKRRLRRGTRCAC